MSLHFSELKRGDRVFEEIYATAVEVLVLTEPQRDGDQWTFLGLLPDGTTVRYLMTEGHAHYGPRLYREPSRALVQRLPAEIRAAVEAAGAAR